MININGYICEELNNDKSGFSKWGFAVKGGKEYFIKELLNPVYPMDRTAMSESQFQKRREYCFKYETRFKNYYTAINQASCGNLVRIIEFFRCDTKYYVVTEKIDTKSVSLQDIASAPLLHKLMLLKSAIHCFACLHNVGIVHFDVKTANILVKRTRNGKYAAKLIDFDSGYFVNEEREEPELGGDLTYLAPETFLGIAGEDVIPDEKSDIFAMGLVFHEYMCGSLPKFNQSEYEYPYEAALDGGALEINSAEMPKELADIIKSMLDADPKRRPSANEIMKVVDSLIKDVKKELPVKDTPVNKEKVVSGTSGGGKATENKSWFSQAGDL